MYHNTWILVVRFVLFVVAALFVVGGQPLVKATNVQISALARLSVR
jgi:hypothetical protein